MAEHELDPAIDELEFLVQCNWEHRAPIQYERRPSTRQRYLRDADVPRIRSCIRALRILRAMREGAVLARRVDLSEHGGLDDDLVEW